MTADEIRRGRARESEQSEGVSAVLVGTSLFIALCFSVILIAAAYVLLRVRERHVRPSGQFDEQALRLRREVAGVRQEPFDIALPRPTERQLQNQALHQYGWVDRSRRIAHIPVEQAMTWLATPGSGPR